ncbi:DUF6024 family protein [Halomonas sp. Y3]|uniref:DUF6024 family protein n=1 Tax=Halomonas sp. Y3 TaxID=2956797 RepID=UPI00263F9740|nr:DUF6024 family protein [Halomonas sp. Y3]
MDVGALNPRLRKSMSGDYYKECQAIREEIKQEIRPQIGDRHSIYLLSNTTHGLLTILSYLASARNLINAPGSLYPGYHFLRFDAETYHQWTIKTHVCPLSGKVIEERGLLDDYTVIDGAQSFFTASYHSSLLCSKIFIAPFHKNLGVQVGLGILAIDNDIDNPHLHEIAKSAESGSYNIGLLQSTLTNLTNFKSEASGLYNCTVINVNKEILKFSDKHQVEIVTPPGLQGPFICLKANSGSTWPESFQSFGFGAKHFSSQGILRISKFTPGSIEERVDYTEKFFEALQYIAGRHV